jgi:AcrR family transcriptional regulator
MITTRMLSSLVPILIVSILYRDDEARKLGGMTDARKPGRPRSETSRRAILDAAMGELQENGYAAVTMDAIAARAGAGKQTIYRWWPSKADLVLEGMLDLAETRIAAPDEGSLHADLVAFLSATFRQRGQRPVLVGLMAQAVLDPTFGAAFRERFLFARRAALRAVLQRSVRRGEIGPEVDLELLIDVVYGVLWYRLLVDHLPLDASAGRELADLLVRAAT